MLLNLRDYQREALEALHKSEAGGLRRGLVAHPTGTGKTVTFSHLIAMRSQHRSIVLAHRDELVRQTVDKITAIAPELKVGVVKAEKNDVGAPVVVASVQTVSRPDRLHQVNPDFGTVVVDEAHHATADTWTNILGHLGSFRDDGPLTAGFTATPARGDGAGLGSVWQEVVHRRSIREMIAGGYLCPISGQTVGTDVDLSRVRVRHGDLVDTEVGNELVRSGAIDQIAGGYVEYASDRKGIAFTPTVATAVALAQALAERGISAEAIHAQMPLDQRREILARLRSGQTQVVTNCAVLTEGFDEPSIECVVIARPTKSHSLYVQMIGRGTRLYPGKADLLVLDVAGASGRHELATVVNLGLAASAEEDEDQDDDEPGTGWLCKVCGFRCDEPTHWCRLCHRPLSPAAIDLGAETHPRCQTNRTAKVDLFASKFRWLPVEDGFCLPAGEATLLLVPRGDDQWTLASVERGNTNVIHDLLPFGYAQGVGEDIARDSGSLAARNARWLESEPTPRQLSRLVREGLPESKVQQVTSRGQAADLITRIGARRALRRLR